MTWKLNLTLYYSNQSSHKTFQVSNRILRPFNCKYHKLSKLTSPWWLLSKAQEMKSFPWSLMQLCLKKLTDHLYGIYLLKYLLLLQIRSQLMISKISFKTLQIRPTLQWDCSWRIGKMDKISILRNSENSGKRSVPKETKKEKFLTDW